MSIKLTGLVSGLDWQSLVDKIMAAKRIPQDRLKTQKESLSTKIKDLEALKTNLNNLKAVCDQLTKPAAFSGRSTDISEASSKIINVQAGSQTLTGVYSVDVKDLATRSTRTKNTGLQIAKSLSETSNVSGVNVATMPLGISVIAGNFTINGKTVSVASTDSLQGVFDKINTATNGDITASYDYTTDTVKLQSASHQKIYLGTSGDTSNFLQALKLFTNDQDAVTSTGKLGVVQLKNTVQNSNLNLTVSEGSFTINGRTFTYTSGKTLDSILNEVNSSDAGVYLTYEPNADRFVLQNKQTGNLDIAVEDTSGNLMEAFGLTSSTSTLSIGKNAQYSINGGDILTSQSNVVGAISHNIQDLTITLKDKGLASFTIQNSSTDIKTKLKDFVDKFNALQKYINDKRSFTTDSSGNTVSGSFRGNSEITSLVSELRKETFQPIQGLTSSIQKLADIGIDFNQQGMLEIKDAKLKTALESSPEDVSRLFTTAENGLAVKLNKYITNFTDKTLTTVKESYESQTRKLDRKISDLERQLQIEEAAEEKKFMLLEQAQSQMQDQLSRLSSFLK